MRWDGCGKEAGKKRGANVGEGCIEVRAFFIMLQKTRREPQFFYHLVCGNCIGFCQHNYLQKEMS